MADVDFPFPSWHLFFLGEPELLNFAPYKVPEIVEIIKDRLESLKNSADSETELPLMQQNAIELCARKAAGMGDLRKALDVVQ